MAANTRDIRRRIKSIKNTAQITKAMQMVAAAKMRKAQVAATEGRPYARLFNKILSSVRAAAATAISSPLLEEREVKRELVVLISTDKGLCGGLNTNLFREASKFPADTTEFITVGKKGGVFLARMKRTILADFPLGESFGIREIKAFSKLLTEKFVNKEVDRVSVVYTEFVNTLSQKPVSKILLPLSPNALTIDAGNGSEETLDQEIEYKFEPSASDVLEALLPHFINFSLYQIALEARASEHSARMVAMKSATDNAQQLVKDLTLEYNKLRQASITTELLEIATAQAAL